MSAPPPPPRRTASPSSASASPSPAPEDTTWKGKMKARGAVWGKKALDKGVQISDNVGGKVNAIAQDRFGAEAFWPTTGDMASEMDKCARILRAFTEQGVVAEEAAPGGIDSRTASATDLSSGSPAVDLDAKGRDKPKDKDKDKKAARKVKVIRKIPPSVIAQAHGLAIFTAFRSGIAPIGGAGGAGVVVARLEDGSWSAPASISPNNLATGFLLGVDVYDAVLILRTPAAVASFHSHKVTLGAELAVAAGPYGAGASVESGLEKAPIFSYVKSRGMYAGIEAVGQVFVERYDENAAFYCWPGIKAGEILTGKVKQPREAASLYAALQDAESGRAQAQTQEGKLDRVMSPNTPNPADIELREGEVLSLPPTPDQMGGTDDGARTPTAALGGTTRRAPPPLPGRRVPPPPPPSADRPHDPPSATAATPSPPADQGVLFDERQDVPQGSTAVPPANPYAPAPDAAAAPSPAYDDEDADSRARVLAAAGVVPGGSTDKGQVTAENDGAEEARRRLEGTHL